MMNDRELQEARDRLNIGPNYEQSQLERLVIQEGESVKVQFTTEHGSTKWLSIPATMVAQIHELFGTLPD